MQEYDVEWGEVLGSDRSSNNLVNPFAYLEHAHTGFNSQRRLPA